MKRCPDSHSFKVRSNIDQTAQVKQESKQEQKVSMPQAFGIGGVLAVVGVIIAIGKPCFIIALQCAYDECESEHPFKSTPPGGGYKSSARWPSSEAMFRYGQCI